MLVKVWEVQEFVPLTLYCTLEPVSPLKLPVEGAVQVTTSSWVFVLVATVGAAGLSGPLVLASVVLDHSVLRRGCLCPACTCTTLLLDTGANPEARTVHGWSAVHMTMCCASSPAPAPLRSPCQYVASAKEYPDKAWRLNR